jgi:hypothetical protein
VSRNLEVCIEKVQEHEKPTEAKAEAIRRLEWVKDLYVTRHHLVHGLPRYEPSGTVLWLKHEPRGTGWTGRDLDRQGAARLRERSSVCGLGGR